ncbi:MAG TPA: DUF2853 family protein [Stellaceae bacterium]|nr:DUF2853 family protein [Stellaceae bacterium]
MSTNWAEDVKKHVPNADEKAIAGIVRYCGIALQNRDSSLVAFSEKSELDYIKEHFLKKKLALTASDTELDKALADAGEKMKGSHAKHRVTVYYLLAQHFNKLGLFA